MRKFVLLPVLMTIFVASSGNAAVVGDVNGDNLVGLPEAINALQVTAGVQTPTTTETPLFNFLEYLPADNSIYVYKVTKAQQDIPLAISYEYEDSQIQTIDGENFMVTDGLYWKNYLKISGDTALLAADEVFDRKRTFSPGITRGYADMKIGDTFSSFGYALEDNYPFYHEYTFQGIEDVTTPTGTYENCLKISRKIAGGTTVRVYYYAKGAGIVKSVTAGGNYLYIFELFSANIDGNQPGGNITTCEGTINLYGIFLPMKLFFSSIDSGYQGQLNYDRHIVDISSEDGTNFTCGQGDSSYPCLSIPGTTFVDTSGKSFSMTSNCVTH